MATEQPAPPVRTAKSKKRLLNRLSALLSALFIAWILSIVLEWLGIAFIWSEQGHLHSQNMMLQEMQWFSEDFTRGLFYYSPVELATSVIATTHHWLFVKTGIQGWLAHPENHGQWEQWFYHYTRAYVESVIYITITFIIRLLIITLTSPLFLLVALAGFTEGLMLRDLRKFGAGRESGFLYHNARRYIFPVMITAWILYLSIPISVHPNAILVPAAALFGLSICVTAASFKKYL
ncbi:TIGR03747 family integrating conjugative element membrane protein [Pasteurella testudinis]|uniref:TIGR03747 family integrating conjugative element membrane protein n=1 Tax=Pasteurella testudinis TaxID=761 RepID=UPI0040592F60